ncbi:tryptophan 7-halogenase [Streptomyces sp. NPDC047079]|uniref:tryptophan 7-halogenase n=1 Tax=Streptomyces sp. NPDC047079 TaxID=3154607 RepID=UPI0033F43A85
MTDITETDVVVVGGGPGGSTVATLVARQGHRVVLLEKERFPRYQIGESLLPSTVQGVCRLLGVSEELEEAGFPVKRGGTFRWGSNPEPWTFDFGISPQFAGTAAPAYQVERMKFDQILLDNARRNGVDVHEEHTVTDVIEENGRVCGVSCTDAAGVRREFRGRYVVDASGNLSRIHSRVGGKRQYSEFFRNLALFGYFTGGKRMPAPTSGNILAVAFSAGWFWYIPLSDELTSVGAVVHREALDRVRGDREQALDELIAECPMIADFLSDAQRVTSGPYGEIRVRKDYSYIQEKFSRPGLVLVGDAAGFIDPVFSSGVHLATYGGLLTARSLNTALRPTTESGMDEKTLFEEYEARYRQEYMRFHDFLVSFYDMHSDEESYFWKAKRVTGNTASELQSFVSLVGGGSSDERALVNAGSYGNRQDVEEAIWSVAQAGANIQVQAATGGTIDEQVPVRDGGLVPSADGMHWALPATAAA